MYNQSENISIVHTQSKHTTTTTTTTYHQQPPTTTTTAQIPPSPKRTEQQKTGQTRRKKDRKKERRPERGACVHPSPHPAARLVVVQVHQHARQRPGVPGVVLLALPHVHEGPGELVAVLDVVAAPAPDPVAVQVLGAPRPAAAALVELRLAARAADGVHHPRRRHRVRERCLPAGCWE